MTTASQPPDGTVQLPDPLGGGDQQSSPPDDTVPVENPVAGPYVAPSMAPEVNPAAIAAKTVGNDLLGAVETAGTGIVNTPHAALSAIDNILQHAGGVRRPQPTYALEVSPTPRAQEFMEAVGSSPLVQNPVTQGVLGAASRFASEHPDITDFAGDVAGLAPTVGAIRGASEFADLSDAAKVAKAARVPPTAEENLASQAAASSGNMGAAVATPSLAGVSPQLRQAISNAKNINQDALTRQIDADTLPQPEGVTPISLRLGSAIENDQQISLERNLRDDASTKGLLAQSITQNDKKLGSSLGEIRRRATPEIVQRSNLEHGQAAIDAIKNLDNAATLDIRAKYKALADANGGAMPIDTTGAAQGINAALAKGFLTRTAAQDPVVSEVMDSLGSGDPMTFEQFENARTNLAAVQRGGGTAAAAAAILRNGLEEMPLSAGASELKGLANAARAAARSRFGVIEQNPAYEAAVNDNVPRDTNGLHVIGAPSPLADNFMDRYFLGNGLSASKAYVARMQALMSGDPDFAKSVEASALNKLRKAAGLDENDTGSFRAASYRNARNAMDPKIGALMSPQSAEWTDQLKRVADYENGVGKAGTINYSNTAPTLLRLMQEQPASSIGATMAGQVASHIGDVVGAHTPGGIGLLAKRMGTAIWKSTKDKKSADATLNFAREATAPGAGIERGPVRGGVSNNSTSAPRAAGGSACARPSGEDRAVLPTPARRAAPASAGAPTTHQAQNRPTDAAASPKKGSKVGSSFDDRTPGNDGMAIRRASGGRVDHEALLGRLMTRWHAARKASSKTTEPLLNFDDATIKKALELTARPPV